MTLQIERQPRVFIGVAIPTGYQIKDRLQIQIDGVSVPGALISTPVFADSS
jgi:hypothetical protein